MNKWDSLSMAEKAEMIGVAVKNGITNLNDIKTKYNEFAEGGDTEPDWSYDSWKRQIAEHMGIRPDEDNTYDYEAYFNKYPEEAWRMLKGDPTAHFTDEFKTVYHPTFSSKSIGNDGSIYSGVRNPKTNPQGLVGGTWSPDYHTFTMSPDGYKGPVSMDERKWYLENAENNGVQLREADGSLPIYDGIPWGGVLPNVTITGNKFAEGGSTDADLVDRIIMEEGNLSKPTNIGDGKITLGSGLTAQKWHDLYKKRGNKWSAADNRRAVAEEVASRRRWAERNVPNWDTLPESSQKALLSYKYNYDFNRSNSPKLFAALEKRDLHAAAKQIDATSKDPKFKKGLQARRQREQQWFLSDVGTKPITHTTIINPVEQPVSTTIFNPYTQQVESTRVAPVMVPDEDSYVTAHRLTEAEERKQRFQEKMEAINNFNRLLQLTSLDNTALPAFMPTTGNPFLDSMLGLTKAEGGGIHIKPSHRGRLTDLKKRTGKTEAELYRTGSAATRKMITFARNARKWKHGDGGNLFDGTTEDSQQMNIAIPDATYIAKTPIFSPISKKEYDWEDAALHRTNQVYSNYNEAKDEPLSLGNTLFRNSLRWIKDNIYEDFPSGVSNCTLSATQWVDPQTPVKGAKSIHANPERFNYTAIDSADVVPGNLIISKVPNKDSYHTMMVTGFAGQDSTANFKGKNYPIKKGEPLMTYSRGGHDNSFIQRNVPLSIYTANSDGHTQNLFYRYKYPREVFLPEIVVTPNKKKK